MSEGQPGWDERLLCRSLRVRWRAEREAMLGRRIGLAEPGALTIALPRLERELDPVAASIADARAAVREWRDESAGTFSDDLELVVSELVTNALRHGRGQVRLVAERRGATVRIEVSDNGSGIARRRTPDNDGGWGLLLIERVAERWGSDAGTVWCELRDPAPAP